MMVSARSGTLALLPALRDTRPTHRYFFKGLTPSNCTYIAGNYRGSAHQCLLKYTVYVNGDKSVGTLPFAVAGQMRTFEKRLDAIALEVAKYVSDPNEDLGKKLYFVIAFAAELHTEFLRIHPYANGNGHIGRFIVVCFAGNFKFWPSTWDIHGRPAEPYAALLTQFRCGDKEPLINRMLECY